MHILPFISSLHMLLYFQQPSWVHNLILHQILTFYRNKCTDNFLDLFFKFYVIQFFPIFVINIELLLFLSKPLFFLFGYTALKQFITVFTKKNGRIPSNIAGAVQEQKFVKLGNTVICILYNSCSAPNACTPCFYQIISNLTLRKQPSAASLIVIYPSINTSKNIEHYYYYIFYAS